jgi:hypothetical protein
MRVCVLRRLDVKHPEEGARGLTAVDSVPSFASGAPSLAAPSMDPSSPPAPSSWLMRLKHRLLRIDRDSYICYALYLIVFVADFSLLSLPFPLTVRLGLYYERTRA